MCLHQLLQLILGVRHTTRAVIPSIFNGNPGFVSKTESFTRFGRYIPNYEAIGDYDFVLGLNTFYGISGFQGSQRSSADFFKLCSSIGNPHCSDFLYLISTFFPDISSNDSSACSTATPFCLLSEANRLFHGIDTQRSCQKALDILLNISSSVFLTLFTHPFPCISVPKVLSQSINAGQTESSALSHFELIRMTRGEMLLQPDNFSCILRFPSVRDALNRSLQSSFWKKALDLQFSPNPSFNLSDLSSAIANRTLGVFHLLGIIPYANQTYGAELLESAARDGDSSSKRLIYFLQQKKLVRFNFSVDNFQSDDPFLNTYFVFHNLSCSQSYERLFSYIESTFLFEDFFNADGALNNNNPKLAFLLYLRLAMMGSRVAMVNADHIAHKYNYDTTTLHRFMNLSEEYGSIHLWKTKASELRAFADVNAYASFSKALSKGLRAQQRVELLRKTAELKPESKNVAAMLEQVIYAWENATDFAHKLGHMDIYGVYCRNKTFFLAIISFLLAVQLFVRRATYVLRSAATE